MKRRHPVRRVTALVASCLLAGLSTSMLQASGASAASPAITVTGQAPATVLAGQPVTFTVTAANPSGNPGTQPEYNTTLREVLPVGLA